jgi:adenylate cyclase
MTSNGRPRHANRIVVAILLFLDQRWVHFLLIACLMTSVAVFLHTSHFRWADFLDNIVLDKYFDLRGGRAPKEVAEKLPHTKDTILIETSHPIPRWLLARLITKLRLAKVVAFDMMFVDNEAELTEDEKDWYKDDVQAWRKSTRLFAEEVKKVGNVALGAWPEEIRVTDEQQAGQYQVKRIWQKPALVLWNSARYRMHLTVDPDEQDGVIRRVRLFENTPERTPCMGLVLAAAASGMSPEELNKLTVRNGFIQLNTFPIPVDEHGYMLIDYLGGRECFEYPTNRIVYQRVLDDFAEPEDFKDKIVIIGEVSIKSKEILPTPFGGMPGMQIHASVAATLLGPQGPPTYLPLLHTAFIALVMSLALIVPLLRLPLWGSFTVAASEVVVTVFVGSWIFVAGHKVLTASVPIMAIALTYNFIALYEYRRARHTLGKFIGHEMVPQALSIFSRLQLGGRVEDASAVFCDVRGYSTLSEYMSPEAVTKLVNEYTSALVKVVKRHKGRPINYQGDGVFVLFEEPIAGKDYAKQAVQASTEIQQVFVEMRKKWEEEGAPQLELGIGIETGEMTIGVVGAEEHMQLSALGDAVNVAARVQGLSKQLGYDVLISSNTYERVRDVISAVYCGSHSVKGREQAVEVYGVGASQRVTGDR